MCRCGNKSWSVGTLWGHVKTQTNCASRCGNVWGVVERKYGWWELSHDYFPMQEPCVNFSGHGKKTWMMGTFPCEWKNLLSHYIMIMMIDTTSHKQQATCINFLTTVNLNYLTTYDSPLIPSPVTWPLYQPLGRDSPFGRRISLQPSP